MSGLALGPEEVEVNGEKYVREESLCDSQPKTLTYGEVGRIVAAAGVLIEEHKKRPHGSENATHGEQRAMWELNFQLGMFRQSRGMTR